jgi:hypothetical protein
MLQKSEAAKGSNKGFWIGSCAISSGGTDGSRSLDLEVRIKLLQTELHS